MRGSVVEASGECLGGLLKSRIWSCRLATLTVTALRKWFCVVAMLRRRGLAGLLFLSRQSRGRGALSADYRAASALGMGAQLTREICVCGVDSRADGKLDATWTAPPLLQRLPSNPPVSKEAWASSGLPGSLPGSLPEERTPQLNARTLAARLLTDAKNGRTDSVKALLDAADLGYEQSAALLGATDQSAGNTPLMLAAKNGYADCCTLLIKHGADIHAQNRHKQTAVDLAGASQQLSVCLRPVVADH